MTEQRLPDPSSYLSDRDRRLVVQEMGPIPNGYEGPIGAALIAEDLGRLTIAVKAALGQILSNR